MGFWTIATILALAVGGLLLLALLRSRAQAGPAAVYDMQVYRDQLREVERDLARGIVTPEEAGRTRTEVSRRLLEADRAAQAVAQAGSAPAALSRAGAAGIALIVVGGALGLYWQIGTPGYPDRPLKTRIADAEAARGDRPRQAEAEAQAGLRPALPQDVDPQFLDLMAKLRAAVAETPGDLRGQKLLARNEAMLGDYSAAHAAQAQVIALKGDQATGADYADLADLLILAAGGYVSPEAETALAEALKREPRNGAARYYTGLMHVQTGRPDLSFDIWRSLLAESRPEAPWVRPINAQIGQVAQMAGVRFDPPASAPAERGPTAADIAAASEMSDEDRQNMIRNMVDGLSDRLATEGGPPEDWARLIGALGVLGDTDKAAAIWTEAQTVFADAPDALASLRAAAVRAGVAE